MTGTTKLPNEASQFRVASVHEVGVVALVVLIIVGALLIWGCGPPI